MRAPKHYAALSDSGLHCWMASGDVGGAGRGKDGITPRLFRIAPRRRGRKTVKFLLSSGLQSLGESLGAFVLPRPTPLAS